MLTLRGIPAAAKSICVVTVETHSLRTNYSVAGPSGHDLGYAVSCGKSAESSSRKRGIEGELQMARGRGQARRCERGKWSERAMKEREGGREGVGGERASERASERAKKRSCVRGSERGSDVWRQRARERARERESEGESKGASEEGREGMRYAGEGEGGARRDKGREGGR